MQAIPFQSEPNNKRNVYYTVVEGGEGGEGVEGRREGGEEGGGQGREREKEEEEGTYHEAMESTVVWVNEQGGQCTGLCCAVPAIRAVH